jgi:hypothetical protein
LKNGQHNGRGDIFERPVFEIVNEQAKKGPKRLGPILSFAFSRCEVGKSKKKEVWDCYLFLVMTKDGFSQIALVNKRFNLDLVKWALSDLIVEDLRTCGTTLQVGKIVINGSWLKNCLKSMHIFLLPTREGQVLQDKGD